jgi:WD40 repeat protein
MIRAFSTTLLAIALWQFLSIGRAAPHRAAAQEFDHAGDPLPAGATMRLGTTRLRQRQGANGVVFSPDGKHLVSMGWGDSIRFWDVETARQVMRLKSSGVTFAAAFSPDGSLLASVGRHLRLWDIATGTMPYEKETGSDRTYSVAFAPDGATIAAAGQDNTVRVWDAKSGEALRELATEGGKDASPVAFSPDGKKLSSGSKTGTIRIWNLNEDAPPIVIEKAHGRDDIVALAFTSDSAGIISGGSRFEDRNGKTTAVSEVYLWNVADGSKLREFVFPFQELLGGACIALSADGSTLVSSHFQWTIAWDTQTGEAIRVIPLDERTFRGGRSHGLAVSPDGRIVASIAHEHKIELWSIESGEPIFTQPDTHHGGILSIDASPDGELVVTGGEEGDVRLWHAVSGQHVRRLVDHDSWIRSVQFLPDGERILVAGEHRRPDVSGIEGIMKLVHLFNGAVLREWLLPDRAMCTALSADGNRVAAALGFSMASTLGEGEPPEIRVWDLKDDRELPILRGHDRQIRQLLFEPDGATLWSASDDGTIRNWNVESGEELEKLSAEAGEGRSPRISILGDLQHAAIGNYVYKRPPEISLGQLSEIEIDEQRGRWQKTLPAQSPYVSVFSPVSQLLAISLRASSAGDANHQILLLEAATGNELLSFELEDGVVRSLAFSRDGRTLYSGMDRGDILVWDVSGAYD